MESAEEEKEIAIERRGQYRGRRKHKQPERERETDDYQLHSQQKRNRESQRQREKAIQTVGNTNISGALSAPNLVDSSSDNFLSFFTLMTNLHYFPAPFGGGGGGESV